MITVARVARKKKSQNLAGESGQRPAARVGRPSVKGTRMENSLPVIKDTAGSCGGCHSTGCVSCSPAPTAKKAKTSITRRALGRAAFMGTAAAFFTGRGQAQDEVSQVSPDLDVVKNSKGPVMTLIDEFFKMGPGPSSSHTMGPMRITYDFYQRTSKLPEDQLKRATGLKVHLFGSLSATGKGHGTDRAALAGLLGKAPATCPPEFLDSLAVRPEEEHKLALGPTSLNLTLKDISFDETKGNFPHPNTMRAVLLAGNDTLYELEYYSVGGGFIEWKGYKPPDKGQPKYPYATMKELMRHVVDNKAPLA